MKTNFIKCTERIGLNGKTCCLLFLFCINTFSLSAQRRVGELRAELAYAETDSAKARISALLAWELVFTKTEDALQLADKAITYGKKMNDTLRLADAYRTEAAGLVLSGKIAEGIPLFDTALFCARRAGSFYYEASCHSLMADMYENNIDFTRAVEQAEKAAQLSQRSGNIEMLALMSNKLAALYQKTAARTELIQEYFQKAFTSFQKLEKWTEAAENSAQLALEYKNTGDTANALAELERASDLLNRDKSDAYRYAVNRSVMASAYFDLNWFEEAERYALSALIIMDKKQHSAGVLQPLSVLCRVYIKTGAWMTAERYAQRLLEEAQVKQDKVFIREACKTFSDIAYLKNDLRAALEYAELYRTWNDSVFLLEKEQAVADAERKARFVQIEMQLKYETQKSEGEKKHRKGMSSVYRILMVVSGVAFVLLLTLGALFFLSRKKMKVLTKELAEEKKKL